MVNAYDLIVEQLAASGAQYTLHPHEPIRNAAEATGKVDFPPEQFLKTVAFRLKGAGWVLAALHPRSPVDYRKLALALGVRRGDLQQATPDEVAEALGFQVGGVCPVPTTDDTQVVYDEAATTMGVVFCGSGRNDQTLEISVTDLMQLSTPIVAPIAGEARA